MGIQIAFRILSNIRMRLYRMRGRASQARLAQIKHEQMGTFYALRNNFPDIYQKLRKYNIAQFTTSMWENYNAKLEKVFSPHPPFLS